VLDAWLKCSECWGKLGKTGHGEVQRINIEKKMDGIHPKIGLKHDENHLEKN
jgi:hypothetical protein